MRDLDEGKKRIKDKSIYWSPLFFEGGLGDGSSQLSSGRHSTRCDVYPAASVGFKLRISLNRSLTSHGPLAIIPFRWSPTIGLRRSRCFELRHLITTGPPVAVCNTF